MLFEGVEFFDSGIRPRTLMSTFPHKLSVDLPEIYLRFMWGNSFQCNVDSLHLFVESGSENVNLGNLVKKFKFIECVKHCCKHLVQMAVDCCGRLATSIYSILLDPLLGFIPFVKIYVVSGVEVFIVPVIAHPHSDGQISLNLITFAVTPDFYCKVYVPFNNHVRQKCQIKLIAKSGPNFGPNFRYIKQPSLETL